MSKESIALKLTKVMGEVQRAPQSGTHHHNYRYHTREDAFIVRPALVKHGIAVTTRSEITDVSTAGKSMLVSMKVEVDFICTDTGQTITAIGIGQGIDSQDQAASKAQTNAIKNAFLNTFLLGTEQHEGYAPEAPAWTPEENQAALANLETVLVSSCALDEEDASIYICEHFAKKKAGVDNPAMLSPSDINAFTERLNNGLVSNHEQIIKQINKTIQTIKGS